MDQLPLQFLSHFFPYLYPKPSRLLRRINKNFNAAGQLRTAWDPETIVHVQLSAQPSVTLEEIYRHYPYAECLVIDHQLLKPVNIKKISEREAKDFTDDEKEIWEQIKEIITLTDMTSFQRKKHLLHILINVLKRNSTHWSSNLLWFTALTSLRVHICIFTIHTMKLLNYFYRDQLKSFELIATKPEPSFEPGPFLALLEEFTALETLRLPPILFCNYPIFSNLFTNQAPLLLTLKQLFFSHGPQTVDAVTALQNWRHHAEDLSFLTHFVKLQVLSLDNISLTLLDELITSLPKLFFPPDCYFPMETTDEYLRIISKIKDLTYLSLKCSQDPDKISATGMKHLAQLKSITDMKCISPIPEWISELFWQCISHLHSLCSLKLSKAQLHGSNYLWIQRYHVFDSLPCLTELDLRGVNLTTESFNCVTEGLCSSLQILSLGPARNQDCEYMEFEFISNLALCSKLQSLRLVNIAWLNDDHIQTFTQQPWQRLCALSISIDNLSNETIVQLSTAALQLQNLRLYITKAACMVSLDALKSLFNQEKLSSFVLTLGKDHPEFGDNLRQELQMHYDTQVALSGLSGGCEIQVLYQ
jgi:hypothetical protein